MEYRITESWRLPGRGDEVEIRVPPVLVDNTTYLAAESLENETEERVVARYDFVENSTLLRAAASVKAESTIRSLSASRRLARVAVVTNESITMLELSTLAKLWTTPITANGDAQLFFSSSNLYATFSSKSSTTVAALRVDSGRSLWETTTTKKTTYESVENEWKKDPEFWKYDANDDSSKNWRELLSRWYRGGRSLGPWRRASESAQMYEEDDVVTFRTERGLESFSVGDGESRGSVRLPAAALHGDFDSDGALDSVSVVESHRPGPQRKRWKVSRGRKARSEREFYQLPACVGVATRGFPPVVERLDEFSLCHDSGVEREIEALERRRRRKKPEPRLYSAPPVFHDDGVFFAVSKGIVSKKSYDGKHNDRWLVYRAPTWERPGEGRIYVVRVGGENLLLVVGASAVALYSPKDGDQLAHFDLAFRWDDETALFVVSFEDRLVVVTQFATYCLRISSKRSSSLIFKLLTFACALVPPSFSLLPLLLFDDDPTRPTTTMKKGY